MRFAGNKLGDDGACRLAMGIEANNSLQRIELGCASSVLDLDCDFDFDCETQFLFKILFYMLICFGFFF